MALANTGQRKRLIIARSLLKHGLDDRQSQAFMVSQAVFIVSITARW